MRILAVGAGSMGRRRLRDLTYLSAGEVILFEPDDKRCQEVATSFGIRGFTRLEAAMAENPEIISISTPPALHQQYVRAAMEREMHVFCELPFVLDLAAMDGIARQAAGYPGVLGVSCTIRYYPPFRLIRNLLQDGAIGRPLYLEYSLGNYLPDWHPYEDYRKFYASNVELGGAGMDMILHELSPIQWWLGSIVSVSARLTKLSTLEITGPDNHDVLLTFESGCRGYFHHDIIEQGTLGRHIRVAGEDGTLEWHQNQPAIRLFEGKAGQAVAREFSDAADWDEAMAASREMAEILARQRGESGRIPSVQAAGFTYESCYLREMRHFIDAVQGRTAYRATNVREELQTVRTFHTILESSRQHCELKVADTR